VLSNDTTYPFSRQQRLLSPSEFKSIFNRPIKVSNAYLSVLARPNGMNQARLGLTVPKKQVKHAVARNRIKRLIRESFRLSQFRLAGFDIVVMVRHAAQNVENRALLAEFDRQWDRLITRCENSSSS